MAGPARLVIEVVSDATPATRALSDIDGAADTAAGSIDKLGRKADEVGRKTGDMGKKAAEGVDEVGGSAGKTATGLNDLAGAFELMNLPGVSTGMGLVATGMDAAAGAADLFTVAQKGAAAAAQFVANTASFQAVKTLALNAAMKVVRVATLAWTAVQWLLNAALLANPIVLIVVGILLLVGALILAYKKSETFRKIVDAAFRAVADAAKWLWDWIKKLAAVVGDALGKAFDGVKDAIGGFIDLIKEGIDWVKRLWDKITSIKLPSWVTSIGGIFKAAPAPAVSPNAARLGVWYPERSSQKAAPQLSRSMLNRLAAPQITVQLNDRKLVDLIQVTVRASATSAARTLTRRRVVTV